MEENIFYKKIVFGGQKILNSENIDLRIEQITNNFRLHTCFFYKDALKVIKTASDQINLIPRLTTKIYFDYIIKGSYKTLFEQMNRICDYLGGVPRNWHVQICCNPSYHSFDKSFDEFKLICLEKFDQNLIFLIETCSLWEENTIKILKSNKINGSVFSLNNYFTNINDLEHFKFPFVCLNLLSGGARNLSINNNLENKINLNLLFFAKMCHMENMLYSVTQVRSKKNYIDLLHRISLLEEFHENKIDLENLLLDKLNVLNSKNADDYGLVFKNPILKIFYNPKRIIHELEKSILNVDKKEWV